MTHEDLDLFFTAGWNAHDVDRLMTFMAGHACARPSPGSSRPFRTYASSMSETWWPGIAGCPSGCFVGTSTDGRKVEVNGCDVFTFRAGKIAVKSSFLKSRS